MSLQTLTGDDEAFVGRRERLVAAWPIVGGVLVVSVLVLGGWLWFRSPHLINPFLVADGLKDNAIAELTLVMMALILPIMTIGCLVILLVGLVFSFVAFANERRLIRIIRSFSGQ